MNFSLHNRPLRGGESLPCTQDASAFVSTRVCHLTVTFAWFQEVSGFLAAVDLLLSQGNEFESGPCDDPCQVSMRQNRMLDLRGGNGPSTVFFTVSLLATVLHL